MTRTVGVSILLAGVGALVGLVANQPCLIFPLPPAGAAALGAAVGAAVVPAFHGLKKAGRGLSLDSIPVKVPFLGTLTFKVNDDQRKVGWRVFVEVATRVASQSLAPGDGSLAAALGSLAKLFDLVRGELKQMTPTPRQEGREASTVESFAIRMLNEALRPCLTRWHPRVDAWEKTARPEADWPLAALCREDLDAARRRVLGYAWGLGEMVGVADLGNLLPPKPGASEPPPAWVAEARILEAERAAPLDPVAGPREAE